MIRDVSLDVLRGLTILEMENTECSDAKFLDHATFEEKKMNYADTIFPCFSFIAGMSSRKKVPIKRDIQLIGLGICFNALPSLFSGDKLRIPGVLQRHGLSSIILNIFAVSKSSYLFPLICATSWLAVSVGLANNKSDPYDKPENTAQQRIDEKVFGDRIYTPTFDPEGLLGALMTAVTIWSGSWFKSQDFNVAESAVVGISALLLGKALSIFFPKYLPISKPIWTPPFTLMSTGWSICKYALIKSILPFLPDFVITQLSNVGKKSLEVYFSGEILLLGLKHSSDRSKSVWDYSKSFLTTILGNDGASEFVLVSSFNLSLVALAGLFVKYGVQLRLR